MEKESEISVTEGKLNREIWRLSFPTMAGMLLQGVYDIVDMIWIGHISASAIAATTIFLTIFWAIEVLNEIVGTSSVALISQSYGQKDLAQTQVAAEQTLIFKALLATVGAVVLLIVLRPALRLFTTDEEVIAYALEYGVIRILFLPIFFSSYSVNTIFRCTGDGRTPMILLIVSALINLVADPLLMFEQVPGTSLRGLGWGMKGATIATVFSTCVAFGIGFALLLRKDATVRLRPKHLLRLDPEIDKKLFLIGLPSGINMFLRNIASLLMLRLIGLYGTAAVAIFGVAMRIYQFGMMPNWGFTMGSGIIIGQNLGAEQPHRALQTVRLTTLNCLLFVGFFATIILFFPAQVLSLFLKSAELPPEALSLMVVIASTMLLGAAGSGMGSAFVGAGENRPLLYASLVSQYLVQIPYLLLVVFAFRLPLEYLWVSFLLGELSEFCVRWLFYRKKTWLEKRVAQR